MVAARVGYVEICIVDPSQFNQPLLGAVNPNLISPGAPPAPDTAEIAPEPSIDIPAPIMTVPAVLPPVYIEGIIGESES